MRNVTLTGGLATGGDSNGGGGGESGLVEVELVAVFDSRHQLHAVERAEIEVAFELGGFS